LDDDDGAFEAERPLKNNARPASQRKSEGEEIMKKLIMTGLIAAAAFSLPVAMANDYKSDTDRTADRSHPGAFVKDSVITTKVKTKLAAKHMATLADIKVDTDNQGMVVLSGKAPSKDASDLAAMIAKDTEGVTSVTNKIVIAE
jgi:hyperosmotically inducible protein